MKEIFVSRKSHLTSAFRLGWFVVPESNANLSRANNMMAASPLLCREDQRSELAGVKQKQRALSWPSVADDGKVWLDSPKIVDTTLP